MDDITETEDGLSQNTLNTNASDPMEGCSTANFSSPENDTTMETSPSENSESHTVQNSVNNAGSKSEANSTDDLSPLTETISIENTSLTMNETSIVNPASPIDESLIETSTMDESSNDSTITTSKTSNSNQSSQCDVCNAVAELSVYKTRTTINGKVETIHKHYCVFCKIHFGLCCKKVRGVFAYVTEEGRILTNAEKAEYLMAQKRKRSSSRSKEEEINDDAPSTSNCPTERENDDKEIDEGIDEIMENNDDEDMKDDEQDKEDGSIEVMEQVVQSGELQRKIIVPRKKGKKHPFGGKTKRTKWSARRKPPRRDENPDFNVVNVQSTSKSTGSKGNGSEPKAQSSSTIVEDKKGRGRPAKSTTRVNNASNQPSTSVGSLPPTPSKCEVQAGGCDFSCQTEKELLLNSAYMEESYDRVMREGFGEQIFARLKDQPLILRKQFIAMLRATQEQEKELSQFRQLKEQYNEAIKNLKEFGRSTRLAFSDEFREIRAHLVERKDEFNTHQAEMMSMFIKERAKYDAHKNQMQQKFEDHKLQYAALEAKVKFLEQENIYEKERAEFFLHGRDAYEKQRDSAEAEATKAVKKLNDRLWLGENEKCSSCQATERQLSRMEAHVRDMDAKTKHAIAERNDAVEHGRIVDLTAKNLAAEVDKTRYERDTFKNTADRCKKEVAKLTQTLKEKEKELLDKTAEMKITTPKSSTTPKSVVCTPLYTERITPPEEADVVKTPPQSSPHATPATATPEKPLIQKIAEKKAPVPIASGFASWISKDKINEPPPELPKALSAFGAPIKTPQQKEAEKPKCAPLSQPTPWEKKATQFSTSDAFTEAFAQAQSESFISGKTTAGYTSKTYTDEMNRVLNSRKRNGEAAPTDANKGTPSEASTPPVKKNKPVNSVASTAPMTKPPTPKPAPTILPSSTSNKAIGATSESCPTTSKRIPKLSEKPPQPEFAPALGLTERTTDDSSIPGLGMDKLDENEKEKEMEELMKIKPAVVKPSVVKTTAPVQQSVQKSVAAQKPNQQTPKATNQDPSIKKINSPQKKNKKNTNRNGGTNPWQRSQDDFPSQKPWQNQPPQQQQYGIQTNHQRNYQMDLGLDRPWSDGSSRNGNNSSSLPWHRDRCDVPMQDTPFGKVPIQDTFGPRPTFPRPPQMPPQQSFYGNPRDSNFYNPPRQPPPNSRMFSPPPPYGYPNNGPRSFYS